MKKLIIVSGLVLISCLCIAQTGDSILMNENALARPLVNHRNQLRLHAGYQLGSIRTAYDHDGASVNLLEQGTSSIEHLTQFDMWYGISDRLQLTASLRHLSSVERKQTVYRYTRDNIRIEENTRYENRGIEDLLIMAEFLVPVGGPKLDWVVSAGATMPVAKSKPDRPQISIADVPDYYDISDDYRIDYHYFNNFGNGAPQIHLRTSSKFRLEKTALNFQAGVALTPLENETVDWSWRLQTDSTVLYRTSPATIRAHDRYNIALFVDRQIFPWMNASVGYTGNSAINGWKKAGDKHYEFMNIVQHRLFLSYELLVTHKLWLRQQIGIGVAGRNTRMPTTISATFVYNWLR